MWHHIALVRAEADEARVTRFLGDRLQEELPFLLTNFLLTIIFLLFDQFRRLILC